MNYFLNRNLRLRGFSLVELMITVAIFAVLGVFIYSSYPRLNNILGFNLSVQDVTSRLKMAQIRGASMGGDYRGYGVYFSSDVSSNYLTTSFFDKENESMNSLGIQETNRYFYIDPADKNNPVNDKIDIEDILRNSTIISDLCVKSVSSLKVCGKSSLSVSFVRPSTQANITDYTEDTLGNKNFFDVGYIELRTSKIESGGTYKCVQIYKNGQQSLLNGKCISN